MRSELSISGKAVLRFHDGAVIEVAPSDLDIDCQSEPNNQFGIETEHTAKVYGLGLEGDGGGIWTIREAPEGHLAAHDFMPIGDATLEKDFSFSIDWVE